MEHFTAPMLSMAVLIMQPVDTSERDGHRLLFQYLATMRLRKNLGLGQRVRRNRYWEAGEAETRRRADRDQHRLCRRCVICFSLDCVNQKLITGRALFVFLLLYLHFMKPSGIINMLKVSLILFVIIQQKKEAFSSSSGRDPGLGEDGGPGMSVPWAGTLASDGLRGQVGCGHCLGMVAAPWQTPSPLGGWRDALS